MTEVGSGDIKTIERGVLKCEARNDNLHFIIVKNESGTFHALNIDEIAYKGYSGNMSPEQDEGIDDLIINKGQHQAIVIKGTSTEITDAPRQYLERTG